MAHLGNQSNPRTTRLGRTDYTGPGTTLTDSLQEAGEYRKKLQGYTSVQNIDSVNDNTHVRYFVYNLERRKWLFRMGGLLKRRHEKYIVLSNGRHTWCVQREVQDSATEDVYETKFFKILSKQELSDMAMETQQKEIEKLRTENAALRQYAGLK